MKGEYIEEFENRIFRGIFIISMEDIKRWWRITV
jgi:hypothetical protein